MRSREFSDAIDIRHLRYFLEIARTRNLTRAAANLGIAQPPLTRQIRQLEAWLGITLFQRRPGGVVLTHAGELFRNEAAAVIEHFDKAISVARELPEHIHVGFAPSPTDEFRDAAIMALERALPNVRFIQHDYSVGDCVRKIAQRELEFALTVEPHGHRLRSIRFHKLVKYRLMCAVAASGPLGNAAYMPIEQLSRERVLIFSRTQIPQYLRDVQDALKPFEVRLRPAQEYDGIEELLPAVRAGHGVALLLESARHRAGKHVRFLPLRPNPKPVPVGVIYNVPAKKLIFKALRILDDTVPRIVRSRARRI